MKKLYWIDKSSVLGVGDGALKYGDEVKVEKMKEERVKKLIENNQIGEMREPVKVGIEKKIADLEKENESLKKEIKKSTKECKACKKKDSEIKKLNEIIEELEGHIEELEKPADKDTEDSEK